MGDQRDAPSGEPIPQAHRVLLPLELQGYSMRCVKCKEVFVDQASFRRQHLRPNARCRYRCTTDLYARLRLANHPTSAWSRDPTHAAQLVLTDERERWGHVWGKVQPPLASVQQTELCDLPAACKKSVYVLGALHFPEAGIPKQAPTKRCLQRIARRYGRKIRYTTPHDIIAHVAMDPF